MHDTEIAKALRQVTPGDAGAVAVKHRIQTVDCLAQWLRAVQLDLAKSL